MTLTFIASIYVISFVFSPFPYWKTYFYLWRTIFLNKNDFIGARARIKEALFLIKYVLFCPIWTFFWYADELIYSRYKKVDVQPIFIIGQPRCGTTLLHRTLAADDKNFLAIKHFEWRFPYISFQKAVSLFGLTELFCKINYWPKTDSGKLAAQMHPNRLSDWEEDGIFYEECFLHHFFVFLRFPYPELFSMLDSFASLPHRTQLKILKTHHKVIQKILFLHNAEQKYYLSKEVTSHDKIPLLLGMYPDAKFIINVREANDFLSSLVPLVRYSTMSKIGVDPLHIPGWEELVIQKMRKDCKLLLKACYTHIHKNQQQSISFNKLVTDLKSCIENIYAFLELPMYAEYAAYLCDLHQTQKNRNCGYKNRQKNYSGFHQYDYFVKKADSETVS